MDFIQGIQQLSCKGYGSHHTEDIEAIIQEYSGYNTAQMIAIQGICDIYTCLYHILSCLCAFCTLVHNSPGPSISVYQTNELKANHCGGTNCKHNKVCLKSPRAREKSFWLNLQTLPRLYKYTIVYYITMSQFALGSSLYGMSMFLIIDHP